ncbi:hypothetical protein Ssi03_74340 [Sphaerisporangium siamense]|uniref:Uncharacterized protein n=1 Tax=Sphaerisporangium siamense TaxID=795645 RepID=A0A7W7D915_9ACTN|nr:hypothetical protein [Sphaerisporangium siamense]MBB4702286.1 hypothetical protein [Sphaerisporangium siamense]GII89444.1 hypothetical protein Ssi03_74340 [Sphaerisporangium siamense]
MESTLLKAAKASIVLAVLAVAAYAIRRSSTAAPGGMAKLVLALAALLGAVPLILDALPD